MLLLRMDLSGHDDLILSQISAVPAKKVHFIGNSLSAIFNLHILSLVLELCVNS